MAPVIASIAAATTVIACSGTAPGSTDPGQASSSGGEGTHDASPGGSDGPTPVSAGDGGGAGPHSDAGGSSGEAGGEGGGTSGGDGGGGASSSGGGDGGAAAGNWWKPTNAAPSHYHWQLSTKFAYPGDVVAGQGDVVYDIDGETNDAATVAQLHALGSNVKVVCYVDVGTYENYRSDASQFPASVLGSSNGWPGEQWLDVRQQSILLPIMKNRFVQWCVNKGFDAIEPDNLDGWENSSGFPLTQAENLAYDTAIADLAHSLGLSVGLKNLPDVASTVEPSFDWALDEQCTQYSECSAYTTSFLAHGKAVWDVEYNVAPDCTTAGAAHMNAQKRDLNLVGPSASGYVYQPCIADSQTTWP
jgi:hypothetical protein